MRSGASTEHWPARDDRRDIDAPALACRADGTNVGVKLGNVSYDGCLLLAAETFSIGEKIRLVLPRMGEIKAQIRWVSLDGQAGAKFLPEEIGAEDQHSKLGL